MQVFQSSKFKTTENVGSVLISCVHCTLYSTVGWVGGVIQRSYFQKIPESKILRIRKVFLGIITQGKIGILNKNILDVFLVL